MLRRLSVLVLLATGFGSAAAPPSPWPKLTKETRPWTYWWWMGSAVDAANLTKELSRYRDAGLGGVHIIPIYGAKGFENRYLDYLSPRWMAMLNHTISEAQRLGLGVDMTTGTGWCFGGPGITGNDACTVASWKNGELVVQTCRQAVKRSGPGGAGPMLNPYSAEAMRKYLTRFSEAFAKPTALKPRAVYHDSFEYQGNWSADLPGEFRRRRGYALDSRMAQLFGDDSSDATARLKSDYRETLSDLMVEGFSPAWTDWAREKGFLTRYQAHGSPANLLDLYALADVPETEMFRDDRNSIVSQFASSAAHVMGRKYVASETGTWLREHFNERLGDLKDLVDQLFLAGVNHVFYHGTAYSPDEAAWPGWLFYASTEMNPRNAFWRDVPALNTYIARTQSLLQSGKPDNDVLVYWPVYDVWHDAKGLNQNLTVHHRDWIEKQPAGALAVQLNQLGYAYDFVSDRQVAAATVRSGRIAMPGGEYRALVVPPVEHIPEKTLARLAELLKSGAPVLFADRLPHDVPGLGDLEARRAQFQATLKEIAGRTQTGPIEALLANTSARREQMPVSFVRRVNDTGTLYFLANRTAQRFEGWVRLGVDAGSALLLDPMTSRFGLGAVRNRKEVFVQLTAGQSVFVQTSAAASVQTAPWSYWTQNGEPLPVTGTWQVSFLQGGPKLPAAFQTVTLKSWTDHAETFAGTALYKVEFDMPSGGGAPAWWIDLGDVRESARVRLNGKYLGTLIQTPFTALLTEPLNPKANVLEVEVTNLSANRIRDLDRRKVAWHNFNDIGFVNWDYKPFDASAWPVRESGLLGPVTLRPAAKLTPAQ